VKISAVLITYNEEKNIADAIKSVEWADEVLVVDSESTDRTREIAASLGARVITRSWPGFAAQKQFAVDSAENDWVLSLDADERVSPELREEILNLKNNGAADYGYRLPRLSFTWVIPSATAAGIRTASFGCSTGPKGVGRDVRIHES
jgi:glycosyltransferase involved in cell wall biosynthesis